MKFISCISGTVALLSTMSSLIADPAISPADSIQMDLLSAPHIGSVIISKDSSDKPIFVTANFTRSRSLQSTTPKSWLDAPGRDYRLMRSDKPGIAD